VKKMLKLLFFGSCTFFLLTSCSSHNGGKADQTVVPIKPLSCIVVLPVDTSVDKDKTINFEKAQSLEKGADYATEVMSENLKGNPKVRILTHEQLASLVPEISGGLSGTVSALGQKLNCDGVLTTTIQRFRQREGTEYASDSPSSVQFKMVLTDVKTGGVLWTRDYRETQTSFLSNIFSIEKIQKRGLKWVSAEQLVEQAIKERLAECPYLK
jgi:PBP1b-binding outer membrane lipoprotein LpoB